MSIEQIPDNSNLKETAHIRKKFIELSAKEEIEGTADFIFTLHNVLKELNEPDWLIINPVFEWEKKNWHPTHTAALWFIQEKLQELDLSDYLEIEAAYLKVCDYLTDDGQLAKYYAVDRSPMGVRVWKGLVDRVSAVQREIAVYNYKNGNAK